MKNTALLAVLLCGANAFAQIPTIDPYSDLYSQRQQQSERGMRAQPGTQYERDRAMRNDANEYRRGYLRFLCDGIEARCASVFEATLEEFSDGFNRFHFSLSYRFRFDCCIPISVRQAKESGHEQNG